MVATIRCSDCEREFEDVDAFEEHDCDERDDDPDGGGAAALLADGGVPYTPAEDTTVVDAWKTTYENDDQTHVVALDAGGSRLVFAADFDDKGKLLEIEGIAAPLTNAEMDAAAEQWMSSNPKGILGTDDDDGEGGLLSKFGGDD